LIAAIDFPLGIFENTWVHLLMHVNNYESYKVMKEINGPFKELRSHIGFSPAYFAYAKPT